MAETKPWAAVRETHSGVVFLVGDRAYKLKKPVDLGFLDFTTPAARERVCRREVELNRRLSPDVYLGVAELSGPDGRDHLVVMRRMPDERRLSTLVRRGEPLVPVVRALARELAVFHAAAERSLLIEADGTRDAVLARWRESFAQVRPFHGVVLNTAVATEVELLVEEFMAGRERLFAQRIAEGRVVDGHGDLIADDVFCLDDGPRVLDCLEFDDHLRHVDGLDDVAFLAMDLDRLDAPELAAELLRRYAEFSGDPAPAALRHHYLAYRAFVRAKVACLRHAQGDPTAAELAREYAEQTRRHLQTGEVRVILVGGLPGVGKSTVAGGLADALGTSLLQSDRVRKELVGIAPGEHVPSGYQHGIYTPEWTDRTYDELVRRSAELLGLGETVVVDASWTSAHQRAKIAAAAANTSSRLVALRCTAPDALREHRLATRMGSYSDAGPEIAVAMATDSDAWPGSLAVDTAGSPEESVSLALALIAEDCESPSARGTPTLHRAAGG
ncbi:MULTISPECIES: AAA family ATPase [unclassified Amycolatopsis]|uniref:bifunctional aminoglycoside phosphotransferase/ATP-binding protein n=1 Tax=unclassified Amycolatopsis TaxID=2618356 RepID=UPI001C6A39B5|nr:AAA family ATPase [Amycolatopsis sp. DSM 110486]QYN20289.1 AAA family ATPase [Amycolatopsis sp. DSM 110486]